MLLLPNIQLMLKVKFRTISTPFRQPFTTSHETKTVQEALLVAIEYSGLRGIGEAPIISYYPVGKEKMISDLQAKAKMIEDYAFTAPDRFWHFCHHLYPDNPFLVCALDLAYWDLYSQFKKQSIPDILNIEAPKSIPTFYTLGMDTEEKMIEKLQPDPWDAYKVKIKDAQSIQVLKTLQERVKGSFVVDANAAWTLADAQKFVPQLQDLGVLFIEQPLAKDNWADMKKLKSEYDILFFADESFQGEADVEKCAEHFDGINIKLTKCSGLTPAVRIIEKAKKMNLKTMLGCMNETETGLYPAAMIGGLTDYNDLDSGLLLDKPLRKMQYASGQIIFNQF